MNASAPMAGIAVRRARDYFGAARSLRILIDEQAIGSVRYGGRTCIALPPGSYSVRVAMDWCRSEPVAVDLRAGEVAELEGGLRWRGLAWHRASWPPPSPRAVSSLSGRHRPDLNPTDGGRSSKAWGFWPEPR